MINFKQKSNNLTDKSVKFSQRHKIKDRISNLN
jgi:hypothetical protein